jgi:AraC-like DNA-binding protein
MSKQWKPPFYLFAAGRGSASNSSYYNDASITPPPRRLLIKHTVSGKGVLYVKKHRMEIPPDHIFVIERPAPYVYCYEGKGEPWKFEYVSIAFTSPAGILPDALSKNPVFSIADQPELKSMLAEMIALRTKPEYVPELIHSALAYRFFLSYVSIRMRKTQPTPSLAEKLRKVLLERYAKPGIQVNECCRELGYTPEALTRVFSGAFGTTPGKYLQELRLKYACDLLRGDKYTIKEVAFLSGFSSQNYFARLFRQVLGVAPGAYRRNPDPLLMEKLFSVNRPVKY